MTNQGMNVHTRAMAERISKGVKFRSLVPENLIGAGKIQIFGKNVERRVLVSVPGLFAISEKEAFVSLLSNDGKVDGFGFFGNDPTFIQWANDFFLHYWNQTDRRYPKTDSNL
jgi:predicted transcriptional regulator